MKCRHCNFMYDDDEGRARCPSCYCLNYRESECSKCGQPLPPLNHERRWSNYEKELLADKLTLFVKENAMKFGRTELAIKARLVKEMGGTINWLR